jgi:hypothetical protein
MPAWLLDVKTLSTATPVYKVSTPINIEEARTPRAFPIQTLLLPVYIYVVLTS